MKSLDSNVEKKNLEGTYKSKTSEPGLSSWNLTEQTKKRDAERRASQSFSHSTGGRFGSYSGIFSNGVDPFAPMPTPKFTATDIGKATINTPTQDKMEAQQVESELETIRESSKDGLDK